MTRRRSILVALVVLSLSVWVWDRLAGGTATHPTSASAAGTTPHEGSVMPASLSASQLVAWPKILRTAFPSILSHPSGSPRPADPESIHDVFAIPASMEIQMSEAAGHGPRINPPVAVGGTQAAEVGSASPTDPSATSTSNGFSERHRLSAVMQGADSAEALIDDQWLQPGDKLDGCILRRIEDQQAVFACLEGEATLSVPLD